MRSLYQEDLAYIHEVGFGDFAADAASGILRRFRLCGVRTGLVVDLGSGSGTWAKALIRSGYEVLGVDASTAMIRLARKRVPAAKFMRRSLHDIALPPCAAVTAIGESLNYISYAGEEAGLGKLFGRIFAALHPRGVFIFDVAEPSLALSEHGTRSFAEGRDWAVLVEKRADASRRLFMRRIVGFRRLGTMYRRSEELHQLRLYDRAEIVSLLEQTGFRARVLRGYGGQPMLPGRVGFLAVKARQ